MTGKFFRKLSPEDDFWGNEINQKEKQLLLKCNKTYFVFFFF